LFDGPQQDLKLLSILEPLHLACCFGEYYEHRLKSFAISSCYASGTGYGALVLSRASCYWLASCCS